MINLSISDPINNFNKIDELRNSIGKIYSDNKSKTFKSKLLKVSDCGNYTFSIEVVGEYAKNIKPSKKIKKEPSYLTWNSIFY